jgi:glycosyltransferase involved in cell wall biosynthesis
MKQAPVVAVLIPCFNEEKTVANVVHGFKKSLPDSIVYVYDNNSTDSTATVALAAGAEVRIETRQGKGNVVRRMFSDIEADIYILVDGDDTYEAAAAGHLVAAMINGPYDKVNCVRNHTVNLAYRRGHVIGNKLLTNLVSRIFGAQSTDMLSGYKALSRRFVKTFPSLSRGFEIETEILVHALDIGVPMSEINTVYDERPPGSFSKLSTFKDGFKILNLISLLVRDLMPLKFFVTIGLLTLIVSLATGLPVIFEFLQTGFVQKLPTAVLASGLMIVAILSFFAGLILDSVSRGRREAKILSYLSYKAIKN